MSKGSPFAPLPPTSTYSVWPGVTGTVAVALAPRPPAIGLPVTTSPDPPRPPVATIWIELTPAGTTNCCSAPIGSERDRLRRSSRWWRHRHDGSRRNTDRHRRGHQPPTPAPDSHAHSVLPTTDHCQDIPVRHPHLMRTNSRGTHETTRPADRASPDDRRRGADARRNVRRTHPRHGVRFRPGRFRPAGPERHATTGRPPAKAKTENAPGPGRGGRVAGPWIVHAPRWTAPGHGARSEGGSMTTGSVRPTRGSRAGYARRRCKCTVRFLAVWTTRYPGRYVTCGNAGPLS